MTLRKITEEQLNDLLERYKKGEALWHLSEEFGLHPSTIWKHAKNHSIHREANQAVAQFNPTPAQERRFREIWPTAFNVEMVAEFGVSYNTLHRLAKRLGIYEQRESEKLRGGGQRIILDLADRDQKLQKLWNGSVPIELICDCLNMSKGGVRKRVSVLRKRGYEIHPRWQSTFKVEHIEGLALAHSLGMSAYGCAYIFESTPDSIHKRWRALNLPMHRYNKRNLARFLMPDNMARLQSREICPVDHLQRIYRMGRLDQVTENEAVHALKDYQRAITIWPRLLTWDRRPMALRPAVPVRDGSKVIESLKGECSCAKCRTS